MIPPGPSPVTPARKRILFLSGTRADFGKLKPLITAVKRSGAFECRMFVTGMHMLARYGSTVNEIRNAGFEDVFAYINQDAAGAPMDLVLANTIQGLSLYLREFPADLVVVHGDRVETLAGAIVGSLNNVLVAHVEGGEVSGTIDELLRHAVTKLSHLHFVSNDEARRRLVQMGEEPSSIFIIGSPDIDVMLSGELPTFDEVRRKYAIPFRDLAICLYHPVTTELADLPRHAEAVMIGLERSQRNFVVIYPNNDAGSQIVMSAMRRLEGHPRFRLIPSMRFEYFLTLLKNAACIVGNSSAGIREAPVYGVPTVNVGSRQRSRFTYPSIVEVAEEPDEIAQVLRHLPLAVPPTMHFGQGDSAARFMSHLESRELWATSGQKQFRDVRMRTTSFPPPRVQSA